MEIKKATWLTDALTFLAQIVVLIVSMCISLSIIVIFVKLFIYIWRF